MADVKIEHLVKNYQPGVARDVLRDINLDIKEGDFVVFVGPSGCGKSTLLRAIAGLDDITSGDLFIGGRRMNEVPPVERGVGMVFQSYALYPHMTVRENLAFGLKIKKVDKQTARERVAQASAMLGLDPFLERKPKDLSGGQRQRVAIGRALVQHPAVFLLDEPLSNLDAALRVKTRIELARMHEERGSTTIYVTHDQVEAMTLATRIAVLSPLAEGATTNLEQFGPPLDLYHEPANRFVAGFIGSPKMNFLGGMIEAPDARRTRIKLDTGVSITAGVDTSRARPGDQVEVGIRPEHTVLLDDPRADNRITGTVLVAEHLGAETFIYLDVGGKDFTVKVRPETPGTPRSQFDIGVPTDACYLFDAQGQAFPRTERFTRT
ncbi:ABC transporter ATP-binding protein [Candidatus Thiodictyon syntrophicum]|jgi:multiple sugar transport system ATP-binding protein|uniref:ABC transporter n=1 Tax=Candidatus Thiodictyon syntrophicum TaxID=1166950 RepID=A0A2K8U1U0_9GAMM|nr:ATP-binding cassette domain-containing protein [Candidatus Thiodictyon syntrophicum]AUB79550.1 ABC transporter [Candidatus Thiodictyon syntrophicum]